MRGVMRPDSAMRLLVVYAVMAVCLTMLTLFTSESESLPYVTAAFVIFGGAGVAGLNVLSDSVPPAGAPHAAPLLNITHMHVTIKNAEGEGEDEKDEEEGGEA